MTESQPPLCWYCDEPVIGGIVTRYQIPRKDGSGFDVKYTHPSGCTIRFNERWRGVIRDLSAGGETCRYVDPVACKLKIQ